MYSTQINLIVKLLTTMKLLNTYLKHKFKQYTYTNFKIYFSAHRFYYNYNR